MFKEKSHESNQENEFKELDEEEIDGHASDEFGWYKHGSIWRNKFTGIEQQHHP